MAESMGIDLQSPRGELRTAFYNPHEVKRRRRTSRSQFKTLEKAFTENPKPDASTRRHLAQRLSMSPRGIQVWFQNRRAKSKQANATPTVTTNGQSNIPCVITFNRDQLHKHNLPNGALTGVGRLEPQVESELFKNKTQNTDGKLHTSINTPTQQTTFTNGTTSSGMPCAGSTITFLLPSAQLPSKMDSRQFQSISHHSTFSSQRGWDDHLHASSLGTQGQASSAYIGQHPLELQQSNYAEDVAKGPLDSNKMVSAIPSTESSISSSVETTELVQGGSQMPLNNCAEMNNRRPSTLSLMRRMSMPASISSSDTIGAIMWSAQGPSSSMEDVQRSLHHTAQNPPDFAMQAPALHPLEFETTALSRPLSTHGPTQPSFEHSGSIMDARTRIQSYPLSRRVSIHETGSYLTQRGLKLKGVVGHDSQSTHSSEGGSRIAAAAAARRRRRSSVGKLANIATNSSTTATTDTDSTEDVLLAGTVSSTFLAPSSSSNLLAFAIPAPISKMNAMTSTSNTSSGMQFALGYANDSTMDIWMEDRSDQRAVTTPHSLHTSSPGSIVEGSTAGAISINVLGICPPSGQAKTTASSTQHSGLLIDAGPIITTLPQGRTEVPKDVKKERRRSSLKTVKTRSQSGARVQFDLQQPSSELLYPFPAANGGENSTHPQQHLDDNNKSGQSHSWLDETLLGIPLNKGKQMNLLDASVATSTAATSTKAPAFQQLPISYVQAPQLHSSPEPDDNDFNSYLAVLQASDTSLGHTTPVVDQASQELQHIRRNSCPPGFIESFNRDLHIVADPSNSTSSQASTPRDVAVLQLQQQLSRQIQVHQQRQDFDCTQPSPVGPSFSSQQQEQTHRQQQQQQQHLISAQVLTLSPIHQDPLATFHGTQQLMQGAALSQIHLQHLGLPPSEERSLLLQEQSPESPIPSDARFRDTNDGLGNNRVDKEPSLTRRMHHSDGEQRHSLPGPYHLPQLQTPRMLAQLQHQFEHPAWSRTLPGSGLRAANARLSLLMSPQGQSMGRRFSEPGNTTRDITGADSALQPDLSQNVLCSPLTLEVTNVDQQQLSFGSMDHAKDTVPRLTILDSSFPKSLHPFDESLPVEVEAPTLAPGSLHRASTTAVTASSSSGLRPSPLIPAAQVASQGSSFSPSPSPSPSLTASKYGANGNQHVPVSMPSSEQGSSPLGLLSPLNTPSSGNSPSMSIAFGQTVEAPLLMRTHSLDSLMWSHTPREPPTSFTETGPCTPSRRHSEGPTSATAASSRTSLSYQERPVYLQEHQLQPLQQDVSGHDLQQPLQSYFQSHLLPSPSSSPFPAQIPLGFAPIEHAYRTPYPQQIPMWVTLPTIMQSPPSHSPQAFPSQSSFQNPPLKTNPSIRDVQGVMNKSIIGDSNVAVISHVATLQRKLPHAHYPFPSSPPLQQQQGYLEQSTPPPHAEGNYHSQPQQKMGEVQSQQGHLAISSAPLLPADLTSVAIPVFSDTKTFEEYKHQMFILEHQRLQKRQEQLNLAKQQQQQQLEEQARERVEV